MFCFSYIKEWLKVLIFKTERYGIKDKLLIETGKKFFAEPSKVLKQELLQRARQQFWLKYKIARSCAQPKTFLHFLCIFDVTKVTRVLG